MLNILLLGAAVHSGALGLSDEDIKEAIKEHVPEKFHAMNLRALAYTHPDTP